MVNIQRDIKSLFTGLCNVYNVTSETDSKGISRQGFKLVLEAVPCRLSYKTNTTSEGVTVGEAPQEIQLFLLNDVNVPAGSRVEVTQNGITRVYKYSGACQVYTFHQELALAVSDYV